MKPVYGVSTKSGQYVCEVFEHPTAGYVWTVDGKRVNYAIPTNLPKSKALLTAMLRISFGDNTLIVEPLRQL
jgi:hypothetical protein